MKRPLNIEFIKAAKDYIILLDKNYPQKLTLKLVGDRYMLSSDERAMLYRGVASEKESKSRNSKLIVNLSNNNQKLHIDIFNQFYHIISYLSGNIVFLSTDGFLRDASEFHRKKIHPGLIEKAVSLFSGYIEKNKYNQLILHFDEQVTLYPVMLKKIEDSLLSVQPNILICPSSSVDGILKLQTSGLLATSDSQVIDKTNLNVFDLARSILEFHFQPDFLDLISIVA